MATVIWPFLISYLGRPTYESTGNTSTLYLYHLTNIHSGIGRWILSHRLNSESQAVHFLDSYAILPHLSQHAADKSDWMIADTSSRETDNIIASSEWQPDTSVSITCADSDTEIDAFYFESSSAYQLELSGFYVRRYLTVNSLLLHSCTMWEVNIRVLTSNMFSILSTVFRPVATIILSMHTCTTLLGVRHSTSSRCKRSELGWSGRR